MTINAPNSSLYSFSFNISSFCGFLSFVAPILIPNCLPHCGHSNISDCPSLYFVSSNVINPSHFWTSNSFHYIILSGIPKRHQKNSLPLRSLRALYASFLVLYFPYTTLMDLLPSIKVFASYPFVVSFVTKASAFLFCYSTCQYNTKNICLA